MIVETEDYLAHYGILRKSGRYPWGSGGTQSARNRSFIGIVDELKGKGMSDVEIAKGFGLTTTQLRAARSIAVNEQRQSQINQAVRLKDKGYSNVAIGQRMGGINESSVRSLLAASQKDNTNILANTANMLKGEINEKGYIDVGSGVERHLDITQTRFKNAVAMLQEEGYKLHYVKVPQLGTVDNQTSIKVLGKPGSKYPKREEIRQISTFGDDGGRSYLGVKPPLNISSKRISVKYAEDGGSEADGVIYVRPGVKDVSIGNSHYAQVRIAVDGTHYLKGMAIYKDDLPAGVDLQFNTNKKNTGNKLDAMKGLKDDADNPFGATIRQITDEHGHLTSAMNIVGSKEGSGVEGGWETWSKNLASQVLSKQSPNLAKHQLDMMYERKRNELDSITALTNPAVRRKLLESFADDADSSAVHLRAAALPGQATHVILPVNSMKPGEIYAPNYKNGTHVALIRYPHGGTFEIPELVVNNKHVPAQKLLGKHTPDAVGIHHSVAERLSGADFDGDTVLVIPNNRGSIKSTPPLEGLKNFDPKNAYPPYHGMRTVDGGHWDEKTKTVDYGGHPPKSANMQKEMGKITNLVADMTIRGANTDEMARAVRHSMVVIDSEKHSLDIKGSAAANGIQALKIKYQGRPDATGLGASTIISRAKSETRILQRRLRRASEGGPIDPATGKKVYVRTGETFVNRKGQTVPTTEKHPRLAVTEDAHALVSDVGTRIERVYADHSNRMKALGNTARKEQVKLGKTPYHPSASKVYEKEVASLNAQLNVALKNAPLERQAQVLANVVVSQKRAANPEMSNADLKKIKNQALVEARIRTGAAKQRIDISDAEWHAIQAGAISNSKLEAILRHADLDRVKELATPKRALLMTSAKKASARAMLDAGFTQAEVASHLGVSLTTLKTNLSEG